MTIAAIALPLLYSVLISVFFRILRANGFIIFFTIMTLSAVLAAKTFLLFYPLHQAGPFIVVPFGSALLVSAILVLYILRR